MNPIQTPSPLRRTAQLLTLIGATSLAVLGCGHDDSSSLEGLTTVSRAVGGDPEREAPDSASSPVLKLPKWFPRVDALAVGETFRPEPHNEAVSHTLRAMGFIETESGLYQRRANMKAEVTLVPSVMPELPSIDAIAVVSIYRPKIEEQYIYPTLRSLFAELPAGAQVNVLVGNAQTAHLAPDVLADKIGADAAARVHVVPTPEDVAAFFDEAEIGTSPRAAWNYARALRAYTGKSFFMVFEDDVSLSKNSLANLEPWLKRAPVATFAIFNAFCAKRGTDYARKDSSLVISPKLIRRNGDFPSLQGMVYAARVTQGAGTYVINRAGRETHDYMLGRYFAETEGRIGLAHPSIVQHEGFVTSGLSGADSLPQSPCYEPEIATHR